MVGRGGRGILSPGKELRSLLRLRLLPGVGDRTVLRLLEREGSARKALALPSGEFSRLAGTEAEAARGSYDLREQVERVLERCRDLEIRIVPLGDPHYPRALLALVDPPPLLFLRGDISFLERRSVAIVGSRRATATGRRTAERLGRELSDRGIVVVSGLALGIDGAAHRGALQGRGGTLAVLGSGPDRAYPSGNRDLFRRILEEGLVVSEFPPGEGVRPYHFPRRNRVLAGLARAVIVVEAAERSGALITVDHALDLGLDVFAVPGSVEALQARGTNALLRDGAHLLTGADEVLEVMGWDALPRCRSRGMGPGRGRADAAEPETDGTYRGSHRARGVLDALDSVPRSLDQLVERAGLSPKELLATLTRLELEGVVRREVEGWCRPGQVG